MENDAFLNSELCNKINLFAVQSSQLSYSIHMVAILLQSISHFNCVPPNTEFTSPTKSE